jgi:N-acyl-D-aspartate/D-glutamate deacylase
MLVTAADSRWQGMTLADVALELQVEPVEAAIRLIRDGDPSIASFNMSPDDIAHFALQSWVMTGSDGSSGHPRKYATYPKAWQDLVAAGKLSVQQFVHRSSGLVADTLHLCDRGYLRDGYAADIAILDPQHFVAHADYENPTVLSDGIRYLLVNGAMVIDNDNYNGTLRGQVLERGSCGQQPE